MEDQTQRFQVRRVHVTTLRTLRKKGNIELVSKSRETEDDEKGEGSLSISIVPIEIWQISPVKAYP